MMRTILAASLFALATAGTAAAQTDSQFEALLGTPRPFSAYPKPWPLKKLVTPGKLTVATTGASPPRTFVDPATNQLTGSYVELFRKIAADLGLQIEFVRLEWAGVLPGLGANRFDMGCDGASWTTERLSSAQFLMTAPTAVNATVGLTRKDTGIKTINDARGKTVGGVRGEIYFESARKALPGTRTVEFPGMTESLLGLTNGQADMIALNLSNALNVLATAPNRDSLAIVGPALEVFPQSLCVNPNEPDLLAAVNLLLANYRADGTLKAILQKYNTPVIEVELLDRIGY
jgi:ABC-type amino acid transport substrate-binding protein